MRLLTWPAVKKYQTRAFGVDENTALISTSHPSNTTVLVFGQNGVFVFDTSYATATNDYIHNVTVSYLTEDDEWNSAINYISIAMWKTPLKGREELAHAATSHDIFSSASTSSNTRAHPREFAKVACALFNSKDDTSANYTFETNPVFKVTLAKVPNFSLGFQGENSQGRNFTSIINMRVDIDKQ